MDNNDYSGNFRQAHSFNIQEALCEETYLKYPEVYHLSTSEDYPILFKSDEDHKAGMTIIGIVARLHPEVVIFTFEWMSNHLHLVAAGCIESIEAFFSDLRKFLSNYMQSNGQILTLKDWKYSLRRITSLEDFRNVIAYDNRNAFVVNPDVTPFSYKWGTNRCFFAEDAEIRYRYEGKPLHVRAIRSLVKTHKADAAAGLVLVDGYASPFGFCAIRDTERMFRDARHFFYKMSRDIESYGIIAQELGEKVYYIDEELYSIISTLCRKQYQQPSPSLLDKKDKMAMARSMHYDYNASNKQISRILKLDITIVDALFPTKRK